MHAQKKKLQKKLHRINQQLETIKNIWDIGTNPDKFLDKHLGSLGKYVYPSVTNKSEQNSVSIGDVIIQQPVGDVNSLARAIQRELPNTALRTLNKR